MNATRRPSPMSLPLLVPASLFTILGIILVQADQTTVGAVALGAGGMVFVAAIVTMVLRLRTRVPQRGGRR